MIVSNTLEEQEGICDAIVGMGTELNLSMAHKFGFSKEALAGIGPNDFFVAVTSEKEMTEEELAQLTEELMSQRTTTIDSDYIAPSLSRALEHQSDSNLVLFSIPGQYVHREAKLALEKDKHVMIFSDNVSIEEELELKQMGQERGLLVMGPDCGTAIINHVPLAFANVIRPGSIGIVGASGTGTQEVSVLIHKMGQGVSQVIGTGGRDLSAEIGGIMMSLGIEALQNDPETKVIVLISKPPSPEIEQKIIAQLDSVTKPVVINFIAGKQTGQVGEHYFAQSLEEAARIAVKLASGQAGILPNPEGIPLIADLRDSLSDSQKFIKGLYTGGTLANETSYVLNEAGFELRFGNEENQASHAVLDLGDDFYTQGKAHPMIDPSIRAQMLKELAQDSSVAVVIMDFVHGYGSNGNPVMAMLPSIKEYKKQKEERGESAIIIASVCGVEDDPQDFHEALENLKSAGVITFPSNFQAAKFVAELIGGLNE